MDNIYIRNDPAGNIKADKEKSTEKIDGAIATIMGLDRAINFAINFDSMSKTSGKISLCPFCCKARTFFGFCN